MADQGLAKESNDNQSSYSIISFSGDKLPKEYRSLIFSKWLRSLKFGNEYFRLADNDGYYRAYQKYIESLLMRPTALVKIAVLTDDKDTVFGFSFSRGNVLDYVYVHKDNRGIGIGKSLLPKETKYITHLTKLGLAIWPKYPQFIFNPFL